MRKMKKSGVLASQRKITVDKRLILGLGPGKCGTMSLATLLDSQIDATVTHEEFAERMRRHFNNACLLMALKEMLARETGIIGDVAYYWLHYVKGLLLYSSTKFICLKRARNEVIESHWTELDGSPIEKPPTFPGMKTVGINLIGDTLLSEDSPITMQSVKEHTGKMWDSYYQRAEHFERMRPENFRIFPIEDLNSEEGVKEILNFAGFPEDKQVIEVGIWENKRRALLNGR